MAELTKSAKAHARLSHPVIDSDGHWVEYLPALTEYLKKVIGSDGADQYWKAVAAYFGDPYPGYRRPAREEAAGHRMVGGADQEHAGPRHRDAPQAAARTHGRPGIGLRRALSDRPDPDYWSLPGRRGDQARGLSRAQSVRGRSIPRLLGSLCTGGSDPQSHSQRGDRRIGIRQKPRHQGGGVCRSDQPAHPWRQRRTLLGYLGARQRLRLRPGVGQMPGTENRPYLPHVDA